MLSFYFPLYLLIFKGLLILLTFFAYSVVFARNPVHAVLFLIGCFLVSGLCFIALDFDYIGLVFIMVYVGAIAILFLFVIMLLDLRNFAFGSYQVNIFSFFFFIQTLILIVLHYDFFFPVNEIFSQYTIFFSFNNAPAVISEPLYIFSQFLFSTYVYYILLTGYLLLIVMIGVVILLADNVVFIYKPVQQQKNKFLQNYQSVVNIQKEHV